MPKIFVLDRPHWIMPSEPDGDISRLRSGTSGYPDRLSGRCFQDGSADIDGAARRPRAETMAVPRIVAGGAGTTGRPTPEDGQPCRPQRDEQPSRNLQSQITRLALGR